MIGINRWYGIGNMTADPKLKQGQDEKSDRTEFSIAINKPGRDDREQEPTYIDLIAWDKLARQVNEYGRKGRLVYCEGEIEVRKWQDQESGENRRAVRIKTWVVRFLDKPRDDDKDDRRDDRPRDRDDRQRSEEPRRPTTNARDFDDLPF